MRIRPLKPLTPGMQFEYFGTEDDAFAFIHGLHVGAGEEYCQGKIKADYEHDAESEDVDQCSACSFELGVAKAKGRTLQHAEFDYTVRFRVLYEVK